VRIHIEATALSVVTAAVGVIGALTLAPTALADPPPVLPLPPAPAPADPAIVAPPAPPLEGTVQAASADPAAPPAEVPHLSSLQNLPPGTTDTPVDPDQGHGLSYLRDIWHAYQTQEVSGKDALLLLTQRPMDAEAVPPPGMPANPTPPGAPLPVDAPPPAAPPIP
jgi:hypothetical protein